MSVRSPRFRLLHALLVVAGAAGLGLLLWLHGPDWAAVGRALAGMSWTWAFAAVGLNLASALARGLAWRMVVVQAIARPHPRYLDLFSAFFIGIFANGVLPGRVGEVARVGVLVRRLPPRRGLWPALLGSVLAHRLLEIFPSLALTIWVLLAAKVPAWAVGAVLAILAAGGLVLVLGLLAARRQEHDAPEELGRTHAVVERVRQGLGILRSPGAAGRAAALQTVAWTLQLVAVWVAMRAFHFSLPLVAAALVLVLMNVALILPLWPGNTGLQQAAIALPLISYGIVYARGFAYGIGLQAIESSVGYVLGVVFLVREGLTLGRLRTSFVAGENTGGLRGLREALSGRRQKNRVNRNGATSTPTPTPEEHTAGPRRARPAERATGVEASCRLCPLRA